MSKISRLAVLTGIAAASDTGNYFYTAAMPEREPKQNKGSPGAKKRRVEAKRKKLARRKNR